VALLRCMRRSARGSRKLAKVKLSLSFSHKLKHALTIGSEVGQIKVYRERIESQSGLGRREKSALATTLSVRDIDIVMERAILAKADQREKGVYANG
jgi:hypothetical protein